MKDSIKSDDLKFFKLAVPHNACQAKERLNHTRRFQIMRWEGRWHSPTRAPSVLLRTAEVLLTLIKHQLAIHLQVEMCLDFLSEEKSRQNTNSEIRFISVYHNARLLVGDLLWAQLNIFPFFSQNTTKYNKYFQRRKELESGKILWLLFVSMYSWEWIHTE